VQGMVRMRARRGEALSTIDDEVIGPSGLPDEHQSALRLHVLTYLDGGRRRYQERQDQVRRRARRSKPARGYE
jgi:hypothetical protein